jgi:uncharacterized SAM-binding protein YcdF (DUF218 family)
VPREVVTDWPIVDYPKVLSPAAPGDIVQLGASPRRRPGDVGVKVSRRGPGARLPGRIPNVAKSSILLRVLAVAAVVVITALAVVGISGHLLFGRTADDALTRADAVIVLGGEHDGREAFAMRLAADVSAKAVVLSDPYDSDDRLMRRLCANDPPGQIVVICRVPEPADTRGEAMLARVLADEHGWQRIVVVSWRYHLVRARMIFQQCFSATPGVVKLVAVPRDYTMSWVRSEYTYLYQYAGLLKALVQGPCH